MVHTWDYSRQNPRIHQHECSKYAYKTYKNSGESPRSLVEPWHFCQLNCSSYNNIKTEKVKRYFPVVSTYSE